MPGTTTCLALTYGLYTNTGTLDRQATQLAYMVKFYPWSVVPAAGKALVVWRRRQFMTKAQVEAGLDEDKLKLTHGGRTYKIVWAYNNIPTEQEWVRKSAGFLILVDFRVSPAIKEGAVVVFDFGLTVRNPV